jgi:hypothetical protein
LRTFRRETRSAACSSVSPEISSTILLIVGSPKETTGGGVDAEGFRASVAVASRLAELIDHELLVQNMFVNANVVQRAPPYRQDDVDRENVLNAPEQRL